MNRPNLPIPTPQQVEGPYFPVDFHGNEDNILIDKLEQDNILELRGIVQDIYGRPLSNVLIIIWQADSSGRYNHPDDLYLGSLDPHFKYWGQCLTNAQGEYSFITVKPGPYRDKDEFRTPHIHFKVYRNHELQLTTQMYFPGEAMNEDDEHLQNLMPSLRPLLLASIKAKSKAIFNITLS